jgi:ABC-type methionine transport system permease subunit
MRLHVSQTTVALTLATAAVGVVALILWLTGDAYTQLWLYVWLLAFIVALLAVPFALLLAWVIDRSDRAWSEWQADDPSRWDNDPRGRGGG